MCMSSQYAWGRVVLTSPLHRQQDEVGGHRGVRPRLQKKPMAEAQLPLQSGSSLPDHRFPSQPIAPHPKPAAGSKRGLHRCLGCILETPQGHLPWCPVMPTSPSPEHSPGPASTAAFKGNSELAKDSALLPRVALPCWDGDIATALQ